MALRITIRDARNGGFYFEIASKGNYETMATSEVYRAKADAKAAIQKIKTEAATAEVLDVSR